MKFFGYFIFSLTAAASISRLAHADDLAMASNPYSTITERNVFALVPVPVAPDPSTLTPVDPPPKITLNGMMTLFGKPQVLFKFTPKAAAGQPAKDVSLMLGEGERQEEVEVTKIDMTAKVASFINHGVAQDVPLSDTAKLTTPVSNDSGHSMAGGMVGGGGLSPAAAARLARTAGANPASMGGPGNSGNPNNAGAGASGISANAGVPSQIYNPANETDPNSNPNVETAKLAQNYLNAKASNPSQAALFPLTPKDRQALEAAAGAGNEGNVNP